MTAGALDWIKGVVGLTVLGLVLLVLFLKGALTHEILGEFHAHEPSSWRDPRGDPHVSTTLP